MDLKLVNSLGHIQTDKASTIGFSRAFWNMKAAVLMAAILSMPFYFVNVACLAYVCSFEVMSCTAVHQAML